MTIFGCAPTTWQTASVIKRAGKLVKKVMSKNTFSDSPQETCVSSSRINEKNPNIGLMGSSCVLAQGSACSFKQAPSMDSKISRLVILSSGDQWPNRGGDPEKNCKKMHSIPPFLQGARGVTFTGRVPFRALLHREFQVTALTVNNTILIKRN